MALDLLSATEPPLIEDQLLQALEQDRIRDALRHLRGREQSVVILRGLEGRSWTDIQMILGLSEGEARHAWRTARPKLARLLADLR